jgi:hypothetical protein
MQRSTVVVNHIWVHQIDESDSAKLLRCNQLHENAGVRMMIITLALPYPMRALALIGFGKLLIIVCKPLDWTQVLESHNFLSPATFCPWTLNSLSTPTM